MFKICLPNALGMVGLVLSLAPRVTAQWPAVHAEASASADSIGGGADTHESPLSPQTAQYAVSDNVAQSFAHYGHVVCSASDPSMLENDSNPPFSHGSRAAARAWFWDAIYVSGPGGLLRIEWTWDVVESPSLNVGSVSLANPYGWFTAKTTIGGTNQAPVFSHEIITVVPYDGNIGTNGGSYSGIHRITQSGYGQNGWVNFKLDISANSGEYGCCLIGIFGNNVINGQASIDVRLARIKVTDMNGDFIPGISASSASGVTYPILLAPPVLGDVSCDGAINSEDIGAFIQTLTDPDAYATAHPDGNITLADCNQDGLVNGLDVRAFVALLNGG